MTCCLQSYDDSLYHHAFYHASFQESCEVLYPHCRNNYEVPYENRYVNTHTDSVRKYTDIEVVLIYLICTAIFMGWLCLIYWNYCINKQ